MLYLQTLRCKRTKCISSTLAPCSPMSVTFFSKDLEESIVKTRFLIAVLLMAAFAAALRGLADEPAITQDELVRRTQELFDSIAPGNAEPFKKYFAEDAMFFDDKGRSMDKAALVND